MSLRLILVLFLSGGAANDRRSDRIHAHDKPAIVNLCPGLSIEEALRQRLVRGGKVVINLSPGIYEFSKPLVIPRNTELRGSVEGSILRATAPECPVIPSDDCTLRNLEIHNEPGSIRSQASLASALLITNSSRVHIVEVKIQGAASAGILLENASNVLIERCEVAGTLSDGIHITNGSRRVIVNKCHVHDTGDDAIAAVSYRRKALQTSDVIISGNLVKNGKARAITCIGSRNVQISDNRAEDFEGGIYVAFESSYDTYSPHSVVVTRNNLLRCGRSHGMQGLLIASATDVAVTHNTFAECMPAYIADTGAGRNQGIKIQNNTFSDTLENGHSVIEVYHTTDIILTGNRIPEFKSRPPVYLNDVDNAIVTEPDAPRTRSRKPSAHH